jgi:hypothetical protein
MLKLVALLLVFTGAYGTTYSYQMTIEVGTQCECTTPTPARQADTTVCIDDKWIVGVPQQGYVGVNVTQPSDFYWMTYGPGDAYPCDAIVPQAEGNFYCGSCSRIHSYVQSSTDKVVCFRRVGCFLKDGKYLPAGPSPTAPAIRSNENGRVVSEHYEKTSTDEKYDRTSYGGEGDSPAPFAPELPESFRAYAAQSRVTVGSSWTGVTAFLFVFTAIVSFVTGAYVYKRLHKRVEYEEVPDVADKDSLLYA